MDARFRFFKRKQGNGQVHVWPPFEFAKKPNWPGESRVVFQNSTDVTVTFEDGDRVLEASATIGISHDLVAGETKAFNIVNSVRPGNAHEFKITRPNTAGQEPKLALLADNPEIIIVG